MNTYEINYHGATLNHGVYFQVKKNGDDIAAFETREKAAKFVDDLKNTIVLRTKKIQSHFRGIIKKGYFPVDGREMWFVDCESYSGGKPSLLPIMDFKATSKNRLLHRISKFKKKFNLILERTKFS